MLRKEQLQQRHTMKLREITHIGILTVMSFIGTNLQGNPPMDDSEIEQQFERIKLEVPNGDLSVDDAADMIANIMEQDSEWAKTQLFKDALTACYSVALSGDKWKCYCDLSQGELQEILFCVIEEKFEGYNTFTNKDLKSFLLKDVCLPEYCDQVDEHFRADYTYWTYAVIAWILERRADEGDITAKEALQAAVTILEKTLKRLDPDRIYKVVIQLLAIVREGSPFMETPLFQRALDVARLNL